MPAGVWRGFLEELEMACLAGDLEFGGLEGDVDCGEFSGDGLLASGVDLGGPERGDADFVGDLVAAEGCIGLAGPWDLRVTFGPTLPVLTVI